MQITFKSGCASCYINIVAALYHFTPDRYEYKKSPIYIECSLMGKCSTVCPSCERSIPFPLAAQSLPRCSEDWEYGNATTPLSRPFYRTFNG